MKDNKRVVFDCNILLQALSSDSGSSRACVQLAYDGTIKLFISPPLIAEFLDVCSRPKVIRKLHLTAERVDEFVAAVRLVATELTNFPELFAYQRDPDDAHYVNLALAAEAELIVSRDKDLLDLMDESLAESAQFRERFPFLRILSPTQLLYEIRSSPT